MKQKLNKRKYFTGTKKLKNVKMFEEFSELNEGHDGIIGPVGDDIKTKEEAIKLLKTWIADAKEEDGDLRKFSDVKWVGTTTEEKMDKMSMQYEDQYIIAGEVDGEIWMAYSRRS